MGATRLPRLRRPEANFLLGSRLGVCFIYESWLIPIYKYSADIVREIPYNLREDYRDIKDYYAQFECYLRKSVFATTLAVKWIFAGSSNSTYVVAGLEQTLEYKLSYDPETLVALYLGLAPKRKSDKSN